MIDTVLLDLDETLLPYVEFTQFEEQIFASMTDYFADWIAPDLFVRAAMAGVEAMDANRRQGPTNAQAFNSAFCPIAGRPPEEVDEAFHRYYSAQFPALQEHTRRLPEARLALEWLVSNGLRLAVATGFQAPIVAVEKRLKWAGVPMDEFHYSFVTTDSNMHASKPHAEYYEELLEHLDRAPSQCLMVGDDWDHDIAPSTSIGVFAFWITEEHRAPAGGVPLLLGQGSLGDFRRWLERGGLGTAQTQ